jgi:hypothetical protein
LIFDKGEIKKLKEDKLRDHLKAYQRAGAPNLHDMTVKTSVAVIRSGLQEVIDLFKCGEWKPIANVNTESDSNEDEQEFVDVEDNKSDWEDTYE